MTNKLVDFLKSKAAPLIVATGLAASVLTGCNTKIKYSKILHEDATVTSMTSSPGISMQLLLREITESYNITFDGDIDFTSNSPVIYRRFKEGDSASVSYRERYLERYEDLNGDGKKELVNVKPRGYIFIDAQPKGK